MTGTIIGTIYEETYKGYAIEIIASCSSAPGGPVHYWCNFRVQPLAAKKVLEGLSRPDLWSPEQYAATLVEARAYCDREIEEAKKLSLTLSYREAKNLQRALKLAEKQDRVPILDLQKKLESLLE
ncbi:hypothetical protein [Oscillatoria sp. FACHB-1406]|uniref:hypothetical protein n=1 Tax=Oscillatoria sp. FACHB-1406 TaxID=2692846 RepID=UPI001687AE91|nr:hypothetical protein [Oscillatoria sp. FACHB-1406]MBD2576773.1 hypothetical protein [Oscillatoria sp. FACHB-1406]